MEEKQIIGFADYSVTKEGKVLHKGQELTPDTSDTYPKVTLYDAEGNKHTKNVHQLIAAAFCKRTDPKASTIDHKDGNTSNNAADNLEWVTNAENQHRKALRHASDGAKDYAKRLAERTKANAREAITKGHESERKAITAPHPPTRGNA